MDSNASPYTAALSHLIFADTSGGAVTVELPSAQSSVVGRYTVRRLDTTSDITVRSAGSGDTFNGAGSTVTLASGAGQPLAVTFASTTDANAGRGWWVVATSSI